MFDRPRGAVSQRLGTTVLGDDLGSQIYGLFNHRSSTASNNKLIGVSGNTVKYLSGATWMTTTSMGTTTKCRFQTYLDTVAIMNGTDACKSWVGSGGWDTTGGNLDVGNMPVGKYSAILNTRMWVCGVSANPDTMYGSSLESGGTISWTSGNKSFRVNRNDGNGNLTGVKSNGKVILIFKERGLYRYDDNQLDHIVNIGTPSYESIVNDDNGITYFFGQGANSVGFYMTTGGYPKKISRMITKVIEAIDPAFYPNVSGFTDGQSIYWSVGSITLDGITYSNFWAVWNISDQSWEFRNYADSFRVFSQYIDSSGNMTIVGGDTDGCVQTIDSGTTDNGDPIHSSCNWGSIVFTTRGRTKVLNEFVTYAKYFQGLKILVKVDNGNYQEFGIDKEEKRFSPKLRGHKFYFNLSAVNSGEPWQFDGIEVSNLTEEGITI
ncbi:MAG: hypothetical protein WC357_03055 [Candidatus Omnitrophota bacterium]